MAYLVVTVDGKRAFRKALESALVVGRAPDSGVVIQDTRVSRQHCRLDRSEDGAWSLVDLNSRNGTIVHGQRVSVHRLHDGDEIHLGGRVRVTFHAGRMPPARPSDPNASVNGVPVVGPSFDRDSLHDTLTDSRAAQILREHRSSRPRSLPKISPRTAAPAVKAPQRTMSLAFKRPPAKPIVPRVTTRWKPIQNWLRSMRRRLLRLTT